MVYADEYTRIRQGGVEITVKYLDDELAVWVMAVILANYAVYLYRIKLCI